MLFEKRKIFEGETVGDQLARARESKKMSLEALSKKLLIKRDYLEALESGQYHLLPKGVYARNFLREYGRFLGLDYRELLRQFSEESSPNKESKKGIFERQVVTKKQLVSMPALIRNSIIGAIVLICIAYLVILLNNIFEPPKLVIETPPDNITVRDRILLVKGKTDPETDVTINGQKVQVGSDGAFNKELFLENGLNTITIKAKKKYSQEADSTRYILFEQNVP